MTARRLIDLANEKAVAQFIRFGLTGGFLTGLYAVIYWPLGTFVMPPIYANFIAYPVSIATGYVIHSRWSFRGHGRRDNLARRSGRFVIASLVGLALNSAFVWILTGPLVHGPTWWPLIPIVFLTPLATFALNRLWVFG